VNNKEEPACTVVSIVPRMIRQEFPGLIPPVYEIEASDGVTPVTYIVKSAMHFVYLDETRGSLRVIDSPNEVARAICQDFVNSQIGVSSDSVGRPGVFWVVGEVTPEEVLEEHRPRYDQALVLQHLWMTDLARMADNDWNRYRAHNVVSEFQIKIARMLGWNPEQHEWMIPERLPEVCPACSSPVKSGLIICPTCRCILNPEEFKKLQFA
jgi:hypothetical protein